MKPTAQCYFCHKELEVYKLASDVYHVICDQCPEVCDTIYKITPQGIEYWSAAIDFEYEGKEYSACYYPNMFYINLLQMAEDGRHEFSKRVMQLSFCPKKIGPHNIKDKFKTLVVWS